MKVALIDMHAQTFNWEKLQYLEAQYLLSEIKRDTHVLQKNAEVF